jgi:hypothetical protein
LGAPTTLNHLSYNLPPRAIEETSSAAKLTGVKLVIETATSKLTRLVIFMTLILRNFKKYFSYKIIRRQVTCQMLNFCYFVAGDKD